MVILVQKKKDNTETRTRSVPAPSKISVKELKYINEKICFSF